MVLLGDVGDGDKDTAAPSSTPTVTRLPPPGLLPPPPGAGTWILTRFSSKEVLGASTVVIVRRLSY